MSKKIDTLKTYMSTKKYTQGELQYKVNEHFGSIGLKITQRNHFNWWLAIKYMEKNPGAVVFQRKLEELASNWVTCACGNQCYIIPRMGNGAPRDSRLAESGRSFFLAIATADWEWAKLCLEGIEKRSAELIVKEIERR